MKASKLVLTIFIGFILILSGYLYSLTIPSNENGLTYDEVRYVPFETPFKHLVVEEGWNLSLFLGEGLNLGNEMIWWGLSEKAIKEKEIQMVDQMGCG